jgi:hypothetical protein
LLIVAAMRWLALLLLSQLGCAAPRSSLLDTAGFYVVYTVVHNEGEEPIALADFRDRGEKGSSLELVDGDRATVDDVVLVPKEQLPADAVRDESFSYFAKVAPAPSHRFSLLRDGEPKTLHVVEAVPFPSATIDGSKRATARVPDPVLLTWSKVPGTRVSIALIPKGSADCRSKVLEPEPEDRGFYVIDTTTLRAAESTATCTFEVRLTRRRESPIGGPFFGGLLRSISTARVELELR